jgi:magnesium chelatase family protein
MDRMDIQIEVPRLSYDKLKKSSNNMEKSQKVRARIEEARCIQRERFGKSKTNAEMTSRETKEICQLDAQGEKLMKHVFDAKGLSARAHDRILRVSRTIADLSGCSNIRPEHLAEALNYRSLDRQIQA